MKRILAVFIAIMLLAAAMPIFAADAAERDTLTLASWDFESAEEIAEWTILDSDGDGHAWNWSEDGYENLYSNTGDYYMYSLSYDWDNYEPLEPDNWLISPAVAIPADAESVTLSLCQMGYEAYTDMCEVYVSTDGGNTWSTCLDTFQTLPAWVEETVNLTMFAGEAINIAFRHCNCPDGYDIGIDTIELTAVGGSVTPDPLMGDVNFDGFIDTTDVLMIMRHAMNLSMLSDDAILVADMNESGNIDINDALIAMRIALNVA